MVIAAVCQPLAASPPNIVSRSASSSRWNGCGSNSAPNVLIRSLSIRTPTRAKGLPDGEVFERMGYRGVHVRKFT